MPKLTSLSLTSLMVSVRIKCWSSSEVRRWCSAWMQVQWPYTLSLLVLVLVQLPQFAWSLFFSFLLFFFGCTVESFKTTTRHKTEFYLRQKKHQFKSCPKTNFNNNQPWSKVRPECSCSWRFLYCSLYCSSSSFRLLKTWNKQSCSNPPSFSFDTYDDI